MVWIAGATIALEMIGPMPGTVMSRGRQLLEERLQVRDCRRAPSPGKALTVRAAWGDRADPALVLRRIPRQCPNPPCAVAQVERARIALRDADPDEANLLGLVRGFGFAEPERFETAYLAAFGETPLTTLQRIPGARFMNP
jgi:hypothetical protein